MSDLALNGRPAQGLDSYITDLQEAIRAMRREGPAVWDERSAKIMVREFKALLGEYGYAGLL